MILATIEDLTPQNPYHYGSVKNSRNQTVHLYEHPEDGQDGFIVGLIESTWFSTGFHDLSDLKEGSEYMPVLLFDGTVIPAFQLPDRRYYIGTILERNGYFEYQDRILVCVPEGLTQEHTQTFFKWIAKEWRGSDGDDWESSEGGYWTTEQSMVFPFSRRREMTHEEWPIAAKYLSTFAYEEMKNA